MRKYLIAAGGIAALLVFAPLVSAGGPNGVWGKGILSSTLEFYVGSAETPTGFMSWNPSSEDFIYDFHGYNLEQGTTYHLICYVYEDEGVPGNYHPLGSAVPCIEVGGVHIKGIDSEWAQTSNTMFCLVPQSFIDGGKWTPDEYLMADELMWPSETL